MNDTEHLQNLCNMINQKNVILVGSAGNGKTSLLCRMAEVTVASKIPCLLINARDIKEDCTEYIIKKLHRQDKARFFSKAIDNFIYWWYHIIMISK